MRFIALLLACTFVIAIPAIGLAAEIPGPDSQSLNEAERVWEKAIAARGGRERLHAVRNLNISSGGSYVSHRFRIKPGEEVSSRASSPSGISREELFVFPNKYWQWDDLRPAVFGLRVSMYNFESQTKQVISEGEPNYPVEAISDAELSSSKTLLITQLIYLVESKWITPKPLSVRPERIGLKVFDLVQTEVDVKRVDFAIDRKTHLPVRITTYNEIGGKVYPNVLRLSDYAVVEGIKVPLTLEMSDGHKERSTVRFDVEYDQELFTKPLSIEAGPKAWMRVKP